MGYGLGVDLGTTYTAAAIQVNGRIEVAQLGGRRPEIPSLVFVRPDGEVLVGEAAERRGTTEPARLAREFKRRVGDPVPILVGGAPYSAHALTARLLTEVHAIVTRHQEGPPTTVTVTHPANWGPYKRELLGQAIQLADLDGVTLRSEPEAAAVQYAAGERIQPDEVIAVYDLGGGTFDAAVLRKTTTGFELLGEPEGIEQLGGIDFDEAVFGHVIATLGNHVTDLDPDDEDATAALARLRRDCVEAKEGLSFDTEVMIPVALPGLHTRIRLNRSEFEAMITPALSDTVSAVRRALRSASVTPKELRSVLLAGGSSRIPLVAQLLGAEFGRPVVLDPHPEHTIALGAARLTSPTAAGTERSSVRVPAPAAPTAQTPAPQAPADPRTGSTKPRTAQAHTGSTGAPAAEHPAGGAGGDSPAGVAHQHVRADTPPPNDINPDGSLPIGAIGGKASSENPLTGHQSAGEVRADLRGVAAGPPVMATSVRRTEETVVLRGRAAVPPPPGGGGTDTMPALVANARRRRAPRWVLATLSGLGVLAVVAVAIIVLPPQSENSDVTVPNVVGKPKAVAIAELTDANLQLREDPAEFTDTCQVGAVTSQDPLGGGTANRQSQVTIRVCGGKPDVKVPTGLVGGTYESVKATLENNDLAANRVDVNDIAPAGQVIEVNPPPGTAVGSGTVVQVKVSKGNGTVPTQGTVKPVPTQSKPTARKTVPDVVGMSEQDARNTLKHYGFDPVVRYVESSSADADRVTDQNPHAGQLATSGTKVTITVTKVKPAQTTPAPIPTSPAPAG